MYTYIYTNMCVHVCISVVYKMCFVISSGGRFFFIHKPGFKQSNPGGQWIVATP